MACRVAALPGSEADAKFGHTTGAVLGAHSAGALQQADSVQGTPEHFGCRAVADVTDRVCKHGEPGAKLGFGVFSGKVRLDRLLEHGFVDGWMLAGEVQVGNGDGFD